MEKIVSIVTGAGGTLGAAVCERLKNENHTVVAIVKPNGREPKQEENIKKIAIDLGGGFELNRIEQAIVSAVDLSYISELNIVHTAGMYCKCEMPFNQEQFTTWERMFNVHCMSLSVIVSVLFPYFKICSKGHIVAISSNLVHRVNKGSAPYIATKGALESFIKQMAYELGPYNVRCNCIAPGYFRSNLNNNVDSVKESIMINNTPVGRLATVEDIENAIFAFLSHKLDWVTGETLIVDGGNSIGF